MKFKPGQTVYYLNDAVQFQYYLGDSEALVYLPVEVGGGYDEPPYTEFVRSIVSVADLKEKKVDVGLEYAKKKQEYEDSLRETQRAHQAALSKLEQRRKELLKVEPDSDVIEAYLKAVKGQGFLLIADHLSVEKPFQSKGAASYSRTEETYGVGLRLDEYKRLQLRRTDYSDGSGSSFLAVYFDTEEEAKPHLLKKVENEAVRTSSISNYYVQSAIEKYDFHEVSQICAEYLQKRTLKAEQERLKKIKDLEESLQAAKTSVPKVQCKKV